MDFIFSADFLEWQMTKKEFLCSCRIECSIYIGIYPIDLSCIKTFGQFFYTIEILEKNRCDVKTHYLIVCHSRRLDIFCDFVTE